MADQPDAMNNAKNAAALGEAGEVGRIIGLYGWVCPVCRRGVSPLVRACDCGGVQEHRPPRLSVTHQQPGGECSVRLHPGDEAMYVMPDGCVVIGRTRSV